MRNRLILPLCVLLILLLPVVGSGGCNRTDQTFPAAGKKQVIKLGLLRIEDNLPFFVAEYDGILKDQDTEIELIVFNSARERDIALEAGEIQGELADLLAAALLKKGGTPVKAVSLALGATPQEGRFVILAAPGSTISAPHQLSSSAIAVSHHTIIHYLAEEMLKETGVSLTGIRLQNIPDLQLRFDVLLAGKDVAAALLPDPLATLAEMSGARVIIDDTTLASNLSQTVIIFREETLEKQPQAVAKVLQVYREGAGNLNENPEKYKELVIDKARIPRPLEDIYRIPVYSPLQLPTREMVDRVMAWMVGKGLLAEPYTYEEMVAPGFISNNHIPKE